MTSLRTLLLVLLVSLGCGRAPAQEGQAGGAHQGKAVPTMQMKSEDFFNQQYAHMVPHGLFTPQLSADPKVNQLFTFYNVNLFQLIALALMLVLFAGVNASFAAARPAPVLRVFRGWVHWIRDEMVYKVMGKEEGAKYAPYFVYVFFFVCFMNVLGLFPGSTTATATPFVTGAMALTTFLFMLVGGMKEQGVLEFWKGLLPHGLPAWLIPLMVVVELIGLVVKPFALTIRLFATMLAGHLVVYSFIGLVFLFAKMLEMNVFAWATAIPSVAMAAFIYIIESFVVLLQAYIFTYLSIIFVHQARHPAH